MDYIGRQLAEFFWTPNKLLLAAATCGVMSLVIGPVPDADRIWVIALLLAFGALDALGWWLDHRYESKADAEEAE
jgi:hypothetical protein